MYDWSNFAGKKIKCSTCQEWERQSARCLLSFRVALRRRNNNCIFSDATLVKTNQTITEKEMKKKTCIQKQSAPKCLEMILNRKSQCLFYEHKFAIRFFRCVMMNYAHLLVFFFAVTQHLERQNNLKLRIYVKKKTQNKVQNALIMSPPLCWHICCCVVVLLVQNSDQIQKNLTPESKPLIGDK